MNRSGRLPVSPMMRGLLLGASLLLTVLAMRWVDGNAARVEPRAREVEVQVGVDAATSDQPREAPPAPVRSAPAAPARALTIQTSRLERQRMVPEAAGDPFASAAWTPAAVAAAEATERAKREAASPVPPPAPMAPALPFTFFGQLIDGNRRQVFLNHGTATVIVAPGETINNVYRVERIDDDAVHFTYLPLGQQQMLAIPGIPR